MSARRRQTSNGKTPSKQAGRETAFLRRGVSGCVSNIGSRVTNVVSGVFNVVSRVTNVVSGVFNVVSRVSNVVSGVFNVVSGVVFAVFFAVFFGIGLGLAGGSGCGLLEAPDFTGARFETGVAPYEDQGTLELCIGPHRVGQPDTELSGFCVPEGTSDTLQPCEEDRDCRGREMCVCGRCMVKFCTRNDECGPNATCDFTASRCVQTCDDVCDCEGPNARCDIGMCQQMCLVNAECQTGEICSLSRARCLTVPCSSSADCFPEEECLIQREPRYVSGPTVLAADGQLEMWADMDVLGQRMIFRAQSTDPRRFRFAARSVLEPPVCQQGQICEEYASPTVIQSTGGLVMFFVKGLFLYDSSQEAVCGNGVCELAESHVGVCPRDCTSEGIFRAVSTDGTSWTIDPPEPVLAPYYNWEQGGLFSPSALLDPHSGELMLYYETGDGSAIGLARSSDPTGAVFPDPSADNPTVECGVRCRVLLPQEVTHPILWRAVDAVRSPMVRAERDFSGRIVFRMWFSAWGYESPMATSFGTTEQIPANYSIGYAGSADGTQWEIWPFNPVFDRIYPNTFVNHASEVSPFVLPFGGVYYMYYCGADREGQTWENLGYAINTPALPGNERD
jgi:hypothetical protein